jgi:hypothetical protein
MSNSDTRYKEALEAIKRVFSDTSVSVDQTRVSLETLKEDIDGLLNSLPDDEGDGE